MRGRLAREHRRAAAAERQTAWTALTDKQKLVQLIGRGHEHCRQARVLKGEAKKSDRRKR